MRTINPTIATTITMTTTLGSLKLWLATTSGYRPYGYYYGYSYGRAYYRY